MAGSMEGRTVVVFGVANKRSIAWAIAQQMQQAGPASPSPTRTSASSRKPTT